MVYWHHLVDVGQPVRVFVIFTLYGIKENLLQFGGNWPTATATDGTVIIFINRRDFGGSTGKERFIGNIKTRHG